MKDERRGWVKPDKAALEAARGRVVPDLIEPGLKVLFVGINPGLYSGATGHHFARPGNRFWPALHAAGFTPRLLHPSEEDALVPWGVGITNLVARTTATAAELEESELHEGARRLEEKVTQARPMFVAFLGLTTYRVVTGQKRAGLGEQPQRFGGARAWLLPNPSGLNAHYQLPDLAKLFGELRRAAFG